MAWGGARFDVVGRSAVGTAAADAPPTIDRDNPAAPKTGTAFFTCFFFEACFTLGIVASSIPCGKNFESSAPSLPFANAPCKAGCAQPSINKITTSRA
jgi:hypothetical protein